MPTRRGDARGRRSSRRGKQPQQPKSAETRTAPSEERASEADLTLASAEAEPAEEQRAAPAAPARRGARFQLGVNYYPLDSEAQASTEWYAGPLGQDFDELAAGRLGVVRLFASWREIEPEVAQYDNTAIDHLAQAITAAKERKLQIVLCLFADDRHAELTNVRWAQRRDPRSDSYLIEREVEFVRKVVTRFRNEQAILAWDLANEAFCVGFQSPSDLEAWVQRMLEAIRELDPQRPVTLGVDRETLFRESGVDAVEALEMLDFGVSHVTAGYRAYVAEGPLTEGPGTYLPAYLLRMAQRGKPVLLDDAGPFGLDASLAEEAAYLRAVMWTGLMNRAAGTLARRYRDFSADKREPYFVDPREALVGVVDSSGGAKPSFDEMRSFARLVARIDLGEYELNPDRVAVVGPDERYMPLPDPAGLFDPRACLHAFIGMKRAHAPVTVIRESDDFDRWQALVVPSAFGLAQATWVQLLEFAQAGGSLVLSYGGGEPSPLLRDLFGVDFLGEQGATDRLSCRVAQAGLLGDLTSFDVPFRVPARATLVTDSATVVVTDERGGPLVTLNQVGRGRAVLFAFPLERAIAQNDPWATPRPVADLQRLVYEAVVHSAGCSPPVSCDAPEVELSVLQGADDDVLLLLNHSSQPIQTVVSSDRAIEAISDVRGGAAVSIGASRFSVPLGGSGAVGLRLTYR